MGMMTKKALKVSVEFTDENLIDALKDIFRHYGYDLAALTVVSKQEIANRLSEVAKRSEPWKWRYVHNFMAGNIQAGQEFKAAIIKLASLIDGAPLMMVMGKSVNVTALGNVRDGAIVYSDSRKCANTTCVIHFVPRVWNQRYCSPRCKKTK